MVDFVKMHGLGNDYVYVDCTKEQQIENPAQFARFVSDRHTGIGSDGLILICKSDVADFKMRMFNQDGSEAEMCGNGIRCVGKFVYDNALTKKEQISVETLAGIKILNLFLKDGKVEKVRVDMGEPIFDATSIPVLSKENPVKNLKLNSADKEFVFTCVSMGNPHAVTVITEVKDFAIEKYGPTLEVNSAFPNKANIEFIEIVDRNYIKMRVWERGSGETMACGTGACACAIACMLNERVERKVTVELLGGNLEIEWNIEDNHVYMTGTATTVFYGKIQEIG